MPCPGEPKQLSSEHGTSRSGRSTVRFVSSFTLTTGWWWSGELASVSHGLPHTTARLRGSFRLGRRRSSVPLMWHNWRESSSPLSREQQLWRVGTLHRAHPPTSTRVSRTNNRPKLQYQVSSSPFSEGLSSLAASLPQKRTSKTWWTIIGVDPEFTRVSPQLCPSCSALSVQHFN